MSTKSKRKPLQGSDAALSKSPAKKAPPVKKLQGARALVATGKPRTYAPKPPAAAKPQPKRPVRDPEQLTEFGRYLLDEKISYPSASSEIGITRSYVQMLATGAATPQLMLAGKIELWSSGKVRLQGWLPHCSAWAQIRATTSPRTARV